MEKRKIKKIGRVEVWKVGRLEGWKVLEDWMEGWKSGRSRAQLAPTGGQGRWKDRERSSLLREKRNVGML